MEDLHIDPTTIHATSLGKVIDLNPAGHLNNDSTLLIASTRINTMATAPGKAFVHRFNHLINQAMTPIGIKVGLPVRPLRGTNSNSDKNCTPDDIARLQGFVNLRLLDNKGLQVLSSSVKSRTAKLLFEDGCTMSMKLSKKTTSVTTTRITKHMNKASKARM